MDQETALQRQVREARAIIDAAGSPDELSARDALNLGWPTTSEGVSPKEAAEALLERGRACVSLAHEAADLHRSRNAGVALPPREVDLQPLSFPKHPSLAPFDHAIRQTAQTIDADPVWRAAQFLLSGGHEAPSSERAKLCEAWKEHLEGPLTELLNARDGAGRAMVASPSREREQGPARAALQRLEGGIAIANYARSLNSELRDHGISAATTRDAPVFRVADERDRQTELQPLLVRQVAGQEVQVLRPLSGGSTLLLAYTRDLRTSPSSSRTLRFAGAPTLHRSGRRQVTRGVER